MRGVLVDGPEVVAARINRGLTQDELARLARLDAKTVRKAEQGKRIDMAPLTRLAYALATEIGLLLVPDDADAGLQVRKRDTILQWIRAFDAADIEGLLSVYCDDAVLRIPGGPSIPFGGEFKGKEAIRQANESTWANARQEPIRLDEISLFVSENAVTLKGSKGIYIPTGELVRFPCVQIFTFHGHLVSDHEVQFDTLEFVKRFQLLR